jgi:hypothetical protein
VYPILGQYDPLVTTTTTRKHIVDKLFKVKTFSKLVYNVLSIVRCDLGFQVKSYARDNSRIAMVSKRIIAVSGFDVDSSYLLVNTSTFREFVRF